MDTATRPAAGVRPGLDVLRTEELDRLTRRPWFLAYAYSDGERAFADSLGPTRRREFLAGRFAAKEAVAKALGTGFGQGVTPRQIEIDRSRGGAPAVRLSGAAADHAAALGVGAVALSIAHKDGFVVAVAITHPFTK